MMFPKPTRRDRPKRPIRRRKTLAAVRAERKAEGAGVSPEIWQAILAFYGGLCAYCGPRECVGRIVQDHVVPLCRGGQHEPGNVVPACERANFEKGSARWAPRKMHPFRAEEAA